MVSVFDLEQLQSLLQDFYHITRMRITVFDRDLNELVSYPENCAPFCTIIRATAEGQAACAKCDQTACAAAARQNKTYIYRCHAGLTEAIMPLHVGKVLVGYLLFGHVFAYNSLEEGWEVICRCCGKYPVDPEKLKLSLRNHPIISKDYINSAARILHATASYLILERMATLQEDSVAAKLDAYLSEHYAEAITARQLCEKLQIGRSRLYKLTDQLYGCGIHQHIIKLRMDKAKQMLNDCAGLSVTEIATACGFSDYNYFIAVFSKTVGQSPNAYRKSNMNLKSL